MIIINLVDTIVSVLVIGVAYPIWILGVQSLVGIGSLLVSILMMMVSIAGWN